MRTVGLALPLIAGVIACGGGGGASEGGLGGMVTLDGSSTVFPISEAMAEEFQIANPGVRVTVGISGTGGGFKKFCVGETDISDASRPIKESERELCGENGIRPIEVPVAWDVGEEDASRPDYTASEDDNVLVVGVEGDQEALGYFGFAYYEENQDRLNSVAIDNGSGCVAPTRETIESGEYAPLSRPMFIYLNPTSLARPEVRAFVEFYLTNAAALVPEVGYVPLGGGQYDELLSGLPVTD
ncbi:MAG: substrate-binding domain-containing protein [Gemmatimonadales bacterium]